jgi:hypothetical protein
MFKWDFLFDKISLEVNMIHAVMWDVWTKIRSMNKSCIVKGVFSAPVFPAPLQLHGAKHI